MPTLCTIVHRSKKSVGELNPLHPPPRYFTILSLKFAPVGSASDPLSQTSESRDGHRDEETPSCAMLD